MEKLRKLLVILSLVSFGFFLVQAYIVANTNINTLHLILELQDTLFWVEMGIYSFFLAIVLILLTGILRHGMDWVMTLIGYGGLWFLMNNLFSHVFNVNKVFECTFNYGDGCLEALNKFETLDVNLLDINYYLIVLFGLFIIIGSLSLLRTRIK